MDFFKRHVVWFFAFALALLLVNGYSFMFAPPSTFPSGDSIVIARGASVSDIAEKLHDAHVIAHPSLLQIVLRISGVSNRVQAGAYRFEIPQNLFVIAYRITMGVYGIPPVRITFPEGITVRESAVRITDTPLLISENDFLSVGELYEGYLFPDTYLFPLSADAEFIIATMRANFDAKIAPLMSDISASGHSLPDIVIMASLLEKEVRTDANRRIVSGILWNRLQRSMPLQVDAVFGYIYGRDTFSPSFADLETDSPYNTYTHIGLPPGPINNPGLESIDAALHPTQTDYLYYLTGKDDLMHYATTYAGHQENRRKYLH